MTTVSRIIALAQAMGADVKALTDKIGDITSTGWTDQTNLSTQLAEVLATITAMNQNINNKVEADEFNDAFQGAFGSGGSYVADPSSNYLKTASSLITADKLLDAQIKVNTDAIAAINAGGSGVQIDDTAGDGATTVVWSADKVYDAIEAAKQAVKDSLLNGAGAAYDTLKELQDLIVADETIITSLTTAVANRIRYDDVQTLTTAQKLQACTNIGVGDPETDFVAAYTTAKA